MSKTVFVDVCRWHSLQQDIQLGIKHTIVTMTGCFNQQGRNIALGEK